MQNGMTVILIFLSIPTLFSLIGCDSNPLGPASNIPPILLTSSREGTSQLYAMEPDGSNIVRISRGKEAFGGGRWSPDGRKIAVSSSKGQITREAIPLWVMDANGKNLKLIDPIGAGPVWSPDGKRIAYSKDTKAGGFAGAGDIVIRDADGSNEEVVLATPLSERVLDWSKDGTKLLIQQADLRTGDPTELYVIDLDGNILLQLTDNDVSDFGGRWSPDGTKIAYTSWDGQNRDIFLMNADGSGKVNLTDDDRFFVAGFAWSPSGDKIIFTRNLSLGDGVYDNIYTINIDGTGLTLVLSDSTSVVTDWRR